MKFIVISISFQLILILLSCRKDNLVVPEKKDLALLGKVQTAGQPFYEYSYTSANLISEERSKYMFTVHHYNAVNQLESTEYYSDNALLSNDLLVLENALNHKGLYNFVNSGKGSMLTYEYNSEGKLINLIFSQPLISTAERSEFSYDANGRISRETLLWDNIVLGFIDYLYDNNGNLIKESFYSLTSAGTPELSTTTQYEFDNNKNPYRSFYRLMTPGIHTNLNNIIKETLTIRSADGKLPDKVQVTTTSYTYDTRGYPVRKNDTVEFIYE